LEPSAHQLTQRGSAKLPKEQPVKAKTIKQVIRAKIDAWLASIEDEGVRALAKDNTIVTGGAIASMLLKESVNDFDVYFRTKQVTEAVAKYYVARFQPQSRNGIACDIYVDSEGDRVKIVVKSAGVASEEGANKPYEYFEARPEGEAASYVAEVMDDPGDIQETLDATKEAARDAVDDRPPFRPVFLSTNAVTLSDRVQIVLRFYGEPDAIHENYDFVHCTNYWTSWDDNLVLRPAALEALLARELVYVGSRYPVCSVIRLRKFIKRGWSINAGQILKAVMQISALDLTNIEVLQDQLTGVDCAYFCEVIAKLKDKDPAKVNAAYLVEIIDRMF
jgi:hypothetical protein